MPDLQKLHWTNEPKAERIHATHLGYTAQTVYLLGPEPRAALDHSDTVIHSAVRYSEEKQSNSPQRIINNISVNSWEKHFNSMQNSVKATDIRTNATDVETRKNIVQ